MMGNENTTGIRSKHGLIPDDHFENDTAAAIGEPNMTPDQRQKFDAETARIKAEALRIRAARGPNPG
jgi:hypothetical protein